MLELCNDIAWFLGHIFIKFDSTYDEYQYISNMKRDAFK